MFYSFSIVFTPFHHAINNIYKAIKVNTFLNFLNAAIFVKETYCEQVISFIVNHLNLTFVQETLYVET